VVISNLSSLFININIVYKLINHQKRKTGRGEDNLPTSHLAMEGTDNVVFLFSKTSMFDVWPEIIEPS
jgi:hypothetical protein